MMTEPTKFERVTVWCGEMPCATLGYPFGEQTAVFKVGDKIFALAALDAQPNFVTLKVLPEDGEALRAQYKFVREGYYMNRRHWITVDLVQTVPMAEVHELVQDSFHLVAATLTKAKQAELQLRDL